MVVSSSGNDGQTGNALLPSGGYCCEINEWSLKVLNHQHRSKKIRASAYSAHAALIAKTFSEHQKVRGNDNANLIHFYVKEGQFCDLLARTS